MTTAVKIENCGCGHVIVIKRDGQSVDTLYPGEESQIMHIWEGSSLTVEEMPIDKQA
jgi:hypothetical protein